MLNVKADNLDVYERAKTDDETWEREHDTREKLETDVKIYLNTPEDQRCWWGDFRAAKGWLDRQKAITERDMQSKVDELQAALNKAAGKWAQANEREKELEAELNTAEADNEFLRAQIDEQQLRLAEHEDVAEKFSSLSGGTLCVGTKALTDKVAELTAERDELKAQLAQCKESYADAKASRDRLQAQLDSVKYDCLTCDAKTELQAKAAELQAKLDAYDQTHMPLPVDADGAPIHIGDRLLKSTGAQKESFGEVVGVSEDSVWFDYNGNGYESNWANLTRHVKPRTVEEVLREFTDAVFRWDADGGTVADKGTWSEVARPFADEIRELMEVCE